MLLKNMLAHYRLNSNSEVVSSTSNNYNIKVLLKASINGQVNYEWVFL